MNVMMGIPTRTGRMNNPWGCLREERIRCEGGAGWDGERGEVDFSVEVILRELTKTGSHPVALRRAPGRVITTRCNVSVRIPAYSPDTGGQTRAWKCCIQRAARPGRTADDDGVASALRSLIVRDLECPHHGSGTARRLKHAASPSAAPAQIAAGPAHPRPKSH